MIPLNKKLVVGKIVGVHGIKGLVKLISYTEQKDHIFKYPPYYLHKKKIDEIKFHFKQKDKFVCEIPNCKNRDDAMKLINLDISINRSNLPSLDKEEFYQNDLIGYKIQNKKKDNFGIIHNFHNFGAGLICEAKVNEKIYYLPFSRKFLLEINNSSKTIILDLSKELIND